MTEQKYAWLKYISSYMCQEAVEQAISVNILRIVNRQSMPLKLALSVDCTFSLPLPEPPVVPAVKNPREFAAAKAQAALNANAALQAAAMQARSAIHHPSLFARFPSNPSVSVFEEFQNELGRCVFQGSLATLQSSFHVHVLSHGIKMTCQTATLNGTLKHVPTKAIQFNNQVKRVSTYLVLVAQNLLALHHFGK